jgi:hypothetical protein
MIFDHTNLPSRTRPYPVKAIEMRLFRPKELGLMGKAVAFDDMQPAIDAIGNCLSNLDVNQLTVGDFYYLLTYQRIHSLRRNPAMARWECEGAMFRGRENGVAYTPKSIKIMVDNWEAADAETRKNMVDPESVQLDGYRCSHGNYQETTMEDFSLIYLEDDVVLDPRLDFPRCDTLAEYIKLLRDPDYSALADAGRWIKGSGPLIKRLIDLVQGEDNDLFEAACEAERDIQHGIRRTVLKACSHCDHKQSLIFVIDPKAFLL